MLTKSWSRYQVMQRTYWLNWKRLTWSRKTYMYFVADYGLVLFTSDASLTFVDIFPLAETITNLQVVCCFLCFQPWFELWKCQRDFFDRRSKKNGANFAMASRFWLAAYITWIPDPVRKLHHNARQSHNKKSHVTNFNMPMSSSQTK